MTSRNAAAPGSTPTLHELAIFAALEREGTYALAAESLETEPKIVKRALLSLYRRLGAKSAVHAGYLLRQRTYLPKGD